MLLLVMNVSFIVSLTIKYNPKKIDTALSTLSTSLFRYPDDLIITLHKGRLITNYNRPYLLWLENQNEKNLLLALDETATPNKIKLYGSPILLTSQEVVLNDTRTNNISLLPLQYLDDQKITKEKVNQLVQTIDKVRLLLPILFIVSILLFIVLIPFASFIVTFIYLFLASIIVYFVFKLFLQKHFHFRRIFQVSFHAVTFPLFLDYLFMVIRPTIRMSANFFLPLHQIPFPMLFLIILAMFVAMGVHEAHTEEHEIKTHHHRKKR